MFPLLSNLILKWTDLHFCDSDFVDTTECVFSRHFSREYYWVAISADVPREKQCILMRIWKYILLTSSIVLMRHTYPLTKVSANSLSPFPTLPRTEQMLTFSLKNWSWNLLLKQLLGTFPEPYRDKAVCIIFIVVALQKMWGRMKFWAGNKQQQNSSWLPGSQSLSQSLSKYVIYSHNKRAGCLSNGIFKIIATKIETWPRIIMTSYLSENLCSKIDVKS